MNIQILQLKIMHTGMWYRVCASWWLPRLLDKKSVYNFECIDYQVAKTFHFWGPQYSKIQFFAIQKPNVPKTGMECCQNSIAAIRCSLAMLFEHLRYRMTLLKF